MDTHAGSFEEALRFARQFTGRSKVLMLENFNSMGSLCLSIAASDERIAAIVVRPKLEVDLIHKRFIKRARALASAEGALMIWDESSIAAQSAERLQEFYEVRPDLICPGRNAVP
jgi:glutamate-1-semialdehyde aminotransferase